MKNYLPYFRKKLGSIIVLILLNLVTVILGFIEPQITSKIVISLTGRHLKMALYCSIGVFVITLLEVVMRFLKNKRRIQTQNEISFAISWEMARKLSNSTSKSVQEITPSQISERIIESGNFVDNTFNVLDCIWGVFIGIAVLAYVAFISFPIFVLFLFVLIIIVIIQKLIRSKEMPKSLQFKEAMDYTKSFISEISEAFLDIKSQKMATTLKPFLQNSMEKLMSSNVETANLRNKSFAIHTLLQAIYSLTFLILGIYLLAKNSISSQELIVLFMYRNYVNSLFSSLQSISENFASAKSCCIRMNEIFQYQRLEEETFGNKSLEKIDGNLDIENVTLKIEESLILNNVSVKIPSNSFVGTVGNSGSGKSTLLKVLAHEQQPDSGKICIDGVNINELDNFTLRNAIQMLPQFSHLFNMSIRDNLKLVSPHATDEDIWQALKIVDATAFVREHGGLDTIVDNNTLSGGQKQKLALARIALKKTKIILLDEATSALDNLSQENIISTILKAKENHTIILVAHRLSAVKNADLLIFMEEGKILATGTYDELYQKCPRFRKMVNLA